MKKILLGITLLLTLVLVSCTKKEEKNQFDFDQDLDYENMFFDDFDNGINKNHWVIGNQKWGIGNGGVIKENVGYTNDGVVVLQANGDYYDGDLKGIGNQHGKRTGAMIKTREALGPGRYETRMKVMPRFGSTTALWTYYYGNGLNQEIDIELNVENDFHVMMTTNWHTEQQFSTKKNYTDVVLNDFEWHTFRFDWRTNPSRIDYFLDDVLISTQKSYVPTYAGEFNIGNWFPDAWAGVPNFETDYTYVDWFKYTPFKNNDFIVTPNNDASPDNFYPQEPMEYPVANLISNSGFDNDPEAWRYDSLSEVDIVSGEGIGGSNAIKIPKDNIAYQVITGLDETFEMTMIANAKHSSASKGYILLEYHPNEINKIGQRVIKFDSSQKGFRNNDFYEIEETFTIPEGTKQVEISLISEEGDMYFDDLFFNLSKKPRPNRDETQGFDFFEDFSEGLSMDKWNISNRKWGGEHHGGVIHENVHYTKDGNLLLQANGDYYDGPLKGINNNHGRRTGAAVFTKEFFGPGSFEIRAKAMPRFGATTAFWTYNFEDGVNSEIDIELNVNNDFHSVWFSNWLTERDYVSKKMQTPILNNDGDYHTYKINWYTSPVPKIEYYIDGVLYHTETTKIPTLEAQFWLGVWFPNNWAGNPNFETDYLLIDYFGYKKFEDQPYLKTKNGPGETAAMFYPTEPIDLFDANLISNGDLKSSLGYGLSGDALIKDEQLFITADGSAKQTITSIDEKLVLKLKLEALGTDASIEIIYYDKNFNLISKKVIDKVVNSTSYKSLEEEIRFPKGAKVIDIIFKGKNISYQNIYMNLKER